MRECLYISGNEEGWRAEETDNMDMRISLIHFHDDDDDDDDDIETDNMRKHVIHSHSSRCDDDLAF